MSETWTGCDCIFILQYFANIESKLSNGNENEGLYLLRLCQWLEKDLDNISKIAIDDSYYSKEQNDSATNHFTVDKNTDLQAGICFGKAHRTMEGLRNLSVPLLSLYLALLVTMSLLLSKYYGYGETCGGGYGKTDRPSTICFVAEA